MLKRQTNETLRSDIWRNRGMVLCRGFEGRAICAAGWLPTEKYMQACCLNPQNPNDPIHR